MKKPITSKTLRAAKDAGLVSEIPLENKPGDLIAAYRPTKSRLAEYLNRNNTDPEILALMIAEAKKRATAERPARTTVRRISSVIDALEAFRATGDVSVLAAVMSSPRPALSDADWEAIKQYIAPTKRGRTGEHRTSVMPVLHLAHLDYLDQLDLLEAEKKAATTEAERNRIDGLEAVLVEVVAREWRDGQLVLTDAGGARFKDRDGNTIPPPKKVAKDRLVSADNLQRAINGGHRYTEWLKENGLPFPT